ncbi:nitrilase/cyanide hydratase and apolipoprotein N-acyltransferase [Penicillium malachiteum]|uniref:Nitrilase/cyanide hydratase and apolipoprotein N-acyltransferase n=1 Tax=Penicillium malachiteum TaxID=1324776 RepID=A0AAD6MV50_9EURO|nr:nitrilase/cyanide hydratase and apolipoprotein N-acyltransferase [Penicillium malachiteum]
MMTETIKIAAAQLAPVSLDKQATTDKVCQFIREAGDAGARVIGFPECIIPEYPAWDELIPMDRSQAHRLFRKLFFNSVEVPGPETEQIGQACKDSNLYAIIGVNERCAGTTGTTFNTQLLFGPDGSLLNKHQKYVPTVAERLIHANGQTGTSVSVPTDFGCLSGLICGENANPLAMYSLSLKYPVFHVASWPTHFTPEIEMQSCILNSTRGLAYALKCFVINSVGIIGEDEHIRQYLEEERRKPLATILGPDDNILAGPLKPGDGILYADINPSDVIVPKYAIDIAGHYNRPELFAQHFAKYFEGSGQEDSLRTLNL